jgi:hypothetical protein
MWPALALVSALFSQAPAHALPSRGVYALADEAFVAQASADLDALRRYASGLRRLQAQLSEQKALFEQDAKKLYSPDEKRTLLTTWGAFFDYVVSIEALRQRYWGFVKVTLTPSNQLKHVWGFLLTHGALTTALAHGLTFAELTAGRPQLEVLFDEASPDFGIPRRAFARFKQKVIHVSTTTQLLTGDSYGVLLGRSIHDLKLAAVPAAAWLLQETKLNSEAARAKLTRRGMGLFARNAADITKEGALAAVFPVQKGVAEWLGDTRVRRLHQPLISRAQVEVLVKRLLPGDIVVARQNWFLSNIGLPGFWPHAELYVGTPEELAVAFDGDPDVGAFLAQLPGKPKRLTEHLAVTYPEKWKRYTAPDEHGDPLRIIEALSEGVSFSGVEHGLRVDYLGVMRPRLPQLDKAKAILRAFEYQGRPYDFDFDFFSDATLVCTELVSKAYAPSSDMKGVHVPLVNVAGRMTLPANELVRRFDEEWGRPDRQLDFVAFLDGRESRKDAVEGDAGAFRKTHKRLKWDVAQK